MNGSRRDWRDVWPSQELEAMLRGRESSLVDSGKRRPQCAKSHVQLRAHFLVDGRRAPIAGQSFGGLEGSFSAACAFRAGTHWHYKSATARIFFLSFFSLLQHERILSASQAALDPPPSSCLANCTGRIATNRLSSHGRGDGFFAHSPVDSCGVKRAVLTAHASFGYGLTRHLGLFHHCRRYVPFWCAGG